MHGKAMDLVFLHTVCGYGDNEEVKYCIKSFVHFGLLCSLSEHCLAELGFSL